MRAEYRKQNYVVAHAVSCARTGGEIPAGIFSVSWVLVAIVKISFDVIAEIEQRVGISRDRVIPISILDIPYFSWNSYMAINNGNVSVISRCCFGGILYNRLGMQFLSLTVNMFFDEMGFIEFVKNLDYFLSAKIKFLEKR